MANNYAQFSEMITGLTEEEKAWVTYITGLDCEDTGGNADCVSDLTKLEQELGLSPDELDMWPYFECVIMGDNDLWLYSEEGFLECQLTAFVQAFIRKFRPDYIFSVIGADTCSKPRVGEFGGWWLVVSKDQVLGGNTWDAAQAAVNSIKTGRENKEAITKDQNIEITKETIDQLQKAGIDILNLIHGKPLLKH